MNSSTSFQVRVAAAPSGGGTTLLYEDFSSPTWYSQGHNPYRVKQWYLTGDSSYLPLTYNPTGEKGQDGQPTSRWSPPPTLARGLCRWSLEAGRRTP